MANPWSIALTGCIITATSCLLLPVITSMETPLSVILMGWIVPAINWLLTPIITWIITWIVNKLLAYLIFDASKELRKLEIHTVPALRMTLRKVEEQRMVRAARDDEGCRSDMEMLDKMDMDLKSALCEAEDILDLDEYYRLEKKVIRDRISFERRLVYDLLHHTGIANIISCCRPVLSWFWSYVPGRIKSNQQNHGNAVECLVPITKRIRFWKQIKDIESILTCSKKSDILNQNSGSITVKNTDKGSSSKGKEIDDLYRCFEVHKVFGRDEDRAAISKILREGPEPDTYASSGTSKPYSVIGIYGITGSGKTTLAQYVCDYERRAGHFDPIMFILVGRTFSVGHIFRDMLEQITRDNQPNDKDLKSLTEDLEEALKNKRFLLVLDDGVDVKDVEQQGILLKALCVGRSGSKILVTVQRKDAVAALGAHELFRIPDLDEESYFSMFMHHALQSVAVDDAEKYEQIGRKIAGKLRRSQIAAVTVAQRLQTNNSTSFWKATASNDMLNSTMGALWWNYMQLDAVVRRCFAYLGTFPQGYVFEREIVVDLWIAQGFLETIEETEDMEALGQRYFDTLLAFAFLRGDAYFGRYRCTMHDLLHELVVRVAGSDSFRIPVNGWKAENIPSQVQHLFIETYNIAETTVENIFHLGNLRTLIILEKANNKMETNNEADAELVLAKVFDSIFMKLRKLRVLIIKRKQYSRQVQFPSTISEMKHLRYLVLHHLYPNFQGTLTKLYHMQILEVRRHGDLLFSDIRRQRDLLFSADKDMANLIHLRLIRGFTSFPNIGRLTSLREIPDHQFFAYYSLEGYDLKQLKHLNKIRGALDIFFIEFPRKDDALEAHLSIKNRLTKLSLFFSNCNSDPEVLDGLCPPGGLEWLSIVEYNGSRYPSWMLSRNHGDTRKHLGLEFRGCTTQLKSIPEDSKFLIHVRLLRLVKCTWDRLPDNMKHLVSLEELEICSCDNIELLPTMPRSLQEISIIYCSVLSITCQQVGHINWRRIQHIRWQKIVAKNDVVHLNWSSTSPSTEIPGREVIFKSHELDDQLSEHEALDLILSNTSDEPIELSYEFLQNITNDFSQEIGGGGFGVVYMGVVERKKIAVKKLWQKDASSDKQFEDELKCLTMVKHKNIVRFLGYCSITKERPVEYNGKVVLAEERQRFLCFEYVPNKSLLEYLNDESHGHEWDICNQLINGICQGLCYLHTEASITHLDLKPENILLDFDMVPKIADFGISRLFSAERSRIITDNIIGSRLYMAPEYQTKGVITFKCDIFSLGVILQKLLLRHQSPEIDNPQLKRCIEVAQICVNEDPSQRPTIDCIISMLNGEK